MVTTEAAQGSAQSRPGTVTVVEVGQTPETVIARELGPGGLSPLLQPVDMVGELRATGLLAAYLQVDSAADAAATPGLVLLVGSGQEDAAALPLDLRRRTVAVCEVARDQQRDWVARHGLLGLVRAVTWTRWAAGMMGATGVFGRADVADAAGLTPRAETGALTDAGRYLELPELLARYLRAAGPIVLQRDQPGPGG